MMSLNLSELEREILRYLAKYKVAQLKDIKIKFFKSLDETSVYKKMSSLRKKGFILKQIGPLSHSTSVVFTLSRKGAREVLKDFDEDQVINFQVGSEVPLHDLKFSEIGNCFERSKRCLDFLTENMVSLEKNRLHPVLSHTFQDLKSDGFIRWGASNDYQWIALEYESSLKNLVMLDSKLRKFYTYPHIDYVFYFCNGPKILNAIRRLDLKIVDGEESKVYCCEYQKDTFASEKIQLVNCQDTEIELELF